MSDSEIGCCSAGSMASCTATGAPIWAVAEAGVWFFTPALLGFLRVFELTAHGNRTIPTLCGESVNHYTNGWIVFAQFAIRAQKRKTPQVTRVN